jgi:hypothetical protein
VHSGGSAGSGVMPMRACKCKRFGIAIAHKPMFAVGTDLEARTEAAGQAFPLASPS